MKRIKTLSDFTKSKQAEFKELRSIYGIKTGDRSRFMDELYAIACEHVPCVGEKDGNGEQGYNPEALEAVWTILTLKLESLPDRFMEWYRR